MLNAESDKKDLFCFVNLYENVA